MLYYGYNTVILILAMTPKLKYLHPYPFEKLAQLTQGITPPESKSPIVLSIGEPAHVTPPIIEQALLSHIKGLSNYPTTKGVLELRQSISDWLVKRFNIPTEFINPETQVLPVSGTREALFSFAQCVVDATLNPVVIMPNPFYQIYEGAALLAGAETYFLNTLAIDNYLPNFEAAYFAIGRGETLPWYFRNERDVRTLVSFDPAVKFEIPFTGTIHNPIDDCIHQINYCSKIWKNKNLSNKV